MKTTIEIPDALARDVKAITARRGVSMRLFVTQALAEKLDTESQRQPAKPWLKVFDGLPHVKEIREDMRRLDGVVKENFETINPSEWR